MLTTSWMLESHMITLAIMRINDMTMKQQVSKVIKAMLATNVAVCYLSPKTSLVMIDINNFAIMLNGQHIGTIKA